jgi:hypothetical protein
MDRDAIASLLELPDLAVGMRAQFTQRLRVGSN